MRITFERTGGFGNIPLRAEIDTSQMPPERARELEKLVEKARPFDQPAQSLPLAPTPDDYQYEVTLRDGERAHAISTTDSAASDELKLLFDYLGEEALRKLKSK
jgi:hypothetical protein